MSLKTRNTLGDDRGQLLTLDILVSLIPVVLILGISANAMTGVVTQVQGYASDFDNQRVVDSAADVLVKTTGEPGNWTRTSPPNILGLAKYNTQGLNDVQTYYLDIDKVSALNQVFNSTIPNLISNGTNPFNYVKFTISGAAPNTTDTSLSWNIGDESEVSNIYYTRRVALVRFEELLAGLYDINKLNTQNQSCGTQGASGIYMLELNASASDLATFDYWIVAESNDTGGGAQKGSPSSSFWAIDAYPWEETANTTNCDDYGTITSSADEDGSVFTCGVTNPPYAAGSGQDEICDQEETQTGLILYKKRLDTRIATSTNGESRILFQIPAQGEGFNVYLIKTHAGISDSVVYRSFTDYAPVFVDLEAGR